MLDKEWLSTFAPLGFCDALIQSWNALGGGVFIYDEPFLWYVTSADIIQKRKVQPVSVLVQHKEKKRVLLDIDSIHKDKKMDWIIDEENHVAATLFPADPAFDLKAIGFKFFLSPKEMTYGMACYSVGFPYSLAGSDGNNLMMGVLDGIVSVINEERSRLYVTTPAFSGNCGGPLLVVKSPFNGNNGSISIGGPAVYLGGIVIGSVLIKNGNETSDQCQAPSLHLGEIIPSNVILNLLRSSDAEMQKKKI